MGIRIRLKKIIKTRVRLECELGVFSEVKLAEQSSMGGTGGGPQAQAWPENNQIQIQIQCCGRIRDILVRIRIRGSVPLTNGSGFSSGTESGLHHFSKIKSQRSHKTVEIKVFLTIFA
jgi:hypothetical protein